MMSDPIESPRKRLLAGPKAKQGPPASATAPADRKKTRDLPNLSDCHSCGVHINSTNPKHKLQTLPSLWRIVLLCKNCLNGVQSGELCSYCFSEADSECHRCRDCDRSVHKDCVVGYNCSAPWSYCCGSELSGKVGSFRVCVDCWVPKYLENSIRFKRRRRNKVSENLEVLVNDAKKVMENKTRDAVRAKEMALRKAVVARTAAELANEFLGLVAVKDDSEFSVSGSSSGSETTAATNTTDVDEQLAFRLHRAMNSSPRISRNLCLVNSTCLRVPRLRNGGGDLSVSSGSRGSGNASVSRKIEECPSHGLNETTDVRVSQPEVKVYVRRSDSIRCVSLPNLKRGRLVYSRRCKKDKGCQDKGVVVVGNSNTCDDNSLIFEPQTCHKQDEVEYELHLEEGRNPNRLNCDGNGSMLSVERSNGKPDRYLLKYSKRPQKELEYEPQKELEYELHPDDTRNPNHVSCSCTMPLDESCSGERDRYRIKYTKRSVGLKGISNDETNFHYDDSSVESEARAMGVGPSRNLSVESRTLSDASFQSSAVSLEASACAHVLSLEPS